MSLLEDMPKEAQVILPELETLDFIRQEETWSCMEIRNGKDAYYYGFGNKGRQQDFTVLVYFSAVLLTQIREAKSAKTLRTLQLRFENTIWSSVMSSDMSVVTRKEENCFLTTCR